jgi:hypothetical protein
MKAAFRDAMFVARTATGLLINSVSDAQGQSVPVPPPVLTTHELLHKYVWSAVGPAGALGVDVLREFVHTHK